MVSRLFTAFFLFPSFPFRKRSQYCYNIYSSHTIYAVNELLRFVWLFFCFFSDGNGNKKNAKVDFPYAVNVFFGTLSQYGHAVRSFFIRIEVAINGKRTF